MRGNGTSGLPAGGRKAEHKPATTDAATSADQSAASTFAIIQREPEDGTSVLAAEGELDLASAPSLKWALADLLQGGCKQIVVDLGRVTFIDSTALGVMVGIHRSLPVGARLGIVCTNEEVTNIFELTGLDATFDIFTTLDDALAYVRGSAAATG